MLKVFDGHRDRVLAVAFSPSGEYLLSGSHDRTAKIWSIGAENHSTPVATLEEHAGEVKALGWSPEGSTIFTAGADRKIRIWSVDIE
mmetsp:Transcript_29082/g.45584  ORF Transcript_29082/g.45584 Transcript_29082/m.45584 type:complete len:87 (-) Transcript_29082:122-382(-)